MDAVYMQATTSMTGHGGWPMTCVLDHDGNPFFAGTYFPDRPRSGQPSFRQVLEALSDAWTNRADEVTRVAATLREHLAAQGGVSGTASVTGAELLERGGDRTGAGVRPAVGRFRWCAEVPAGDGARVPAADRRRTRDADRGAPDGGRDARGDGTRRHPRPARRWLRALQRRPGLGGAALREDALRQRAAAAGVRRVGDRRSATGSPTASPSSCWASCGRRKAGSPQRWTLTPRARRAPTTSGPRSSWSTCSVPRTVRGLPSCFGVTQAGTFEHGTSTLQLLGTRRARRPDAAGTGRACSAERVIAANGRPATTRSSPRGTAWRSAACAAPGRCSTGRRTSDAAVEIGRPAVAGAHGRRPAPPGLA